MPTSNDADEPHRLDEADRVRISSQLRAVLIPLAVAACLVAGISYVAGNPQGTWTAIAGAFVSAIAWNLNKRGRVNAAVFLLLLGMLAAITVSMSHGEGVHDVGMVIYPSVLILGSLLLRPRTFRVMVGLVLVSVSVVWWRSFTGATAPAFQELSGVDDLLVLLTVLLLQAGAASLLARDLYRSLAEARRENSIRRQAEEALRDLNHDLERRVDQRTTELAEANQELAAFSYSVSHDLRSPLRAVGGYAQILTDDFSANWDPEAQDYLRRILASNARMDSLISELLRFAQLSRGEFVRREVDMRAIARETIELLNAASAQTEVDWVVEPLPNAWGDQSLLLQVYSNLLGNALKFAGKVARPRIEIGFEDGSEPHYFVRDNGVGFDPSQAERVFGVFERLHDQEEFEGTGIGLATVRRIIERHQGRIWAQAEPGEGATFCFTLPTAATGA